MPPAARPSPPGTWPRDPPHRPCSHRHPIFHFWHKKCFRVWNAYSPNVSDNEFWSDGISSRGGYGSDTWAKDMVRTVGLVEAGELVLDKIASFYCINDLCAHM
jgi:hypothetical protein